jgi:3-hydroxyisobutyrate dehydrogenase-like beta-hydroxyacid dehydrogenase
MGAKAEELYQRFVDGGSGNKDFSGLIQLIDSTSRPQE